MDDAQSETSTATDSSAAETKAGFVLNLAIGGTVEDYRDIASVLRNVADELDEPDDGSWSITRDVTGQIYEDGIGVRNRATIGQWQVTVA